MISHRHRFIFIHIPCTGGTSIESALIDDSCELLPNQHDARAPHTPLNHLTLRGCIDLGFIDAGKARTYFKFCFVRDPWERAVSETFYLRSFLSGGDIQTKLMASLQLECYGNYIRPQSDFIEPYQDVVVDFIGRFENLAGDFREVCKIIGLPPRLLPHEPATNYDGLQQILGADSISRIAEKYRLDIEQFGYCAPCASHQ